MMNCLTCTKDVDGNLPYVCKEKLKVNCHTCAGKS